MPEQRNKIRVYCVDDHAIVARGLQAAVDLEPDLEWIGWQSSADGLVEAFDANKPDVVLLDIDMPGADPFVELSDLTELRRSARVLILSSTIRERYVDAAIASGAGGYVSKAAEFEHLFDAIRDVHAGRFVFAPEVLARCVEHDGRLRPIDDGATPLSALSPRELQVLRLVAQGRSTKEIAEHVHRSIKRVESIRTVLMRKLGCSDRLEMMRLAIREGLVDA